MVLLVLGGMYLAVSAKTAQLGRSLIEAQATVEALRQSHDERLAELAALSSPGRMLEAAERLGFRAVRHEQVVHVTVEGVEQPSEFTAPAPPMEARSDRRAQASPAFTETWLDRLSVLLDTGLIR
jgi:hypothetical protein